MVTSDTTRSKPIKPALNVAGVPEVLDQSSERTAKIRMASHITPDPDYDSDDGVPVYRPSKEKHRDGGRREESGAFASALLELADKSVRKQLGAGLSRDQKKIVAKVMRESVEAWMEARQKEPVRAQRMEPRSGLAISIVTAIGLVVAILVGSVMTFLLAERIRSLDSWQRERVTVLETRLTEAENRQIELTAAAEKQRVDLEKAAADHDRRVAVLEARQTALVVYLLESVDLLLKDRRLPTPQVPPELRIAKAQADAAAEIALKRNR